MNCKDFQDQISAAVDRCLARQEMDQFEDHARCCAPCRQEYENERSTKSLLHKHVTLVPVPADVRASIVRRIDGETGLPERAQDALHDLRRAPVARAIVAFALTALLVALLLDRPQNSSGPFPMMSAALGADNVVRQCLDNYHGILRGEIVPQMGSANPLELRDFFAGKTTFPVVVPQMKEWVFLGCSVNEYKGAGLAHVLYRTGEDVLCLYQACWETVQEGKTLELNPEARNALLKTGWYTPPPAGRDAVVLWTDGRTLCIAVSRMGVDRLLASVKSGADGAREGQ